MRTRQKLHQTPQQPRWWVRKRTTKKKGLTVPQDESQPPPNTTPTTTPSGQAPPKETTVQTVEEETVPEIQSSPVNEESESGKSKKPLNEKLKELYTSIKSVPKYGAKIHEFLRSYGLHSKNKRITKRLFPRRRVVARFPFDVWQADLIEYPGLEFHNKNFRYVLLVVDVFTKMVYVEPLKRKMGENTAEAMEKIISSVSAPPVMLVTDRGKEFYNQSFQNVMFSNGINHFSVPSRTKFKASVAERAIRTIKTKLDRYMQHTKKKSWVTVIDDIVDGYNRTPHSAHKLAPLDVNNDNRQLVYKRLYPKEDVIVQCKLKKGDKVRKIRVKTDYEKGYTPNWSEEIYEIVEIRQKHSVCWYKIADTSGKILDGIFYYPQLNLVATK